MMRTQSNWCCGTTQSTCAKLTTKSVLVMTTPRPPPLSRPMQKPKIRPPQGESRLRRLNSSGGIWSSTTKRGRQVDATIGSYRCRKDMALGAGWGPHMYTKTTNPPKNENAATGAALTNTSCHNLIWDAKNTTSR